MSPLLRKVLVCEYKRRGDFVEVLHCTACSGFNCAPALLYSEEEDDSRCFIDFKA